MVDITTTLGHRPACDCNADDPVACRILDPFVGSGTTLVVARSEGCDGVGLDLSHTYLRDQARKRLELDALDAWENGVGIDGDCEPLEELPLFANDWHDARASGTMRGTITKGEQHGHLPQDPDCIPA